MQGYTKKKKQDNPNKLPSLLLTSGETIDFIKEKADRKKTEEKKSEWAKNVQAEALKVAKKEQKSEKCTKCSPAAG